LGYSIVHSPSFTFLVGPEHTKLTIQSALVKHVSQPLDELMNNGQTRESRHHIAVLEGESVETFVGFCEYAYTGDYRVPRRRLQSAGEERESRGGSIMTSPVFEGVPPPAPSPPTNPVAERQEEEPNLDADGGVDGINQAAEGAEVEWGSRKKGKKGKGDKKKMNVSKSLDEAVLTPPRTPPPGEEEMEQKNQVCSEEASGDMAAHEDWLDFDPPKATDIVFAGTRRESFDQHSVQQQQRQYIIVPPPRPQGMTLWEVFTSLAYKHDQQQTVATLPSPIMQNVSAYPADDVPYLIFHARLYVFATRYLVPNLAHLCLTKLHQDLVNFPLNLPDDPTAGGDPNAAAVLELLHFTFTNTKRTDPVFALPGMNQYPAEDENQLRKLVVQYAACKLRELASYQSPSVDSATDGTSGASLGLRQLLASLGELASDLVYCMM
jgi:hypothetical protein